MGDPLCRPWANIPEITVAGLAAGATVHDELKIKPTARFAGGAKAEHFEMILDGLKVRECPPGGSLKIDTAQIADGAHELRVVAAAKGPAPARGETIIPFASANHHRTIEVSLRAGENRVAETQSLLITAKSPQATCIRILRGTALLRTMTGDEGQVEIPAEVLGRGPVRLQVVGIGDAGPKSNVFAPPLDIVVEK